MDRKVNSKNGWICVCCTAVLLSVTVQSFGAVANPFFSTDLADWTTNGESGVVWYSESLLPDGTGSARLQESSDWSSSILSQTFDVEADSETLTFSLRTTSYGAGETDYFWVDLFEEDADQVTLFQWDSSAGEFVPPDYMDYYTYDYDAVNDFHFYNFAIPTDAWNDTTITLRFQLDHGHESPEEIPTYILVDNVDLEGSPSTPIVPAPGAITLVLTGLATIGVFSKKRV